MFNITRSKIAQGLKIKSYDGNHAVLHGLGLDLVNDAMDEVKDGRQTHGWMFHRNFRVRDRFIYVPINVTHYNKSIALIMVPYFRYKGSKDGKSYFSFQINPANGIDLGEFRDVLQNVIKKGNKDNPLIAWLGTEVAEANAKDYDGIVFMRDCPYDHPLVADSAIGESIRKIAKQEAIELAKANADANANANANNDSMKLAA